eukprot:6290-Heterococcus_DN1.PRE.7
MRARQRYNNRIAVVQYQRRKMHICTCAALTACAYAHVAEHCETALSSGNQQKVLTGCFRLQLLAVTAISHQQQFSKAQASGAQALTAVTLPLQIPVQCVMPRIECYTAASVRQFVDAHGLTFNNIDALPSSTDTRSTLQAQRAIAQRKWSS